MADTSNANVIMVTTSNGGSIYDVVRGKTGVTVNPTTNVVRIAEDAYWYAELHGKKKPSITPVGPGGDGQA